MEEDKQAGAPQEAGSGPVIPGSYVSFPVLPRRGRAPKAIPPPGGALRGPVGFVAMFLIILIPLLAGYRYAIPTRPNEAYLFSVGAATAWALSFIGDSARIEPRDMFISRETAIRAFIANPGNSVYWALPPENPPGASEPPLSAWECFLYLSGSTIAQKRLEMEYLTSLAPAPAEDAKTPEDLFQVVRKRFDQVWRTIERTTPGASPVTVSPPLVAQEARELGSWLDELTPVANMDLGEYTRNLQEIARQIEALRVKQAAYVEERAAKLKAQANEIGPRIMFIAHGGSRATPDTVNTKDAEKDVEGDTGESTPAIAATRRAGTRTFSFRVVPDCGAITALAVYLAAVLAFPCPWLRRLAGVAMGIPLLYAVNIARLAALGWLGAIDATGEWFTFFHVYVWQGVYLVTVLAVWMLWMEMFVICRVRTPVSIP